MNPINSIFSKLFSSEVEPKIAPLDRSNPASMLYATSIMMLLELAKMQEKILKNSEKIQLAKRVEALGFTEAYNVVEQKHLSKSIKLLQFMIEMWYDLGRGAILIGHERFRSILRSHDLMCVPFSHYKGDIPAQNLVEIEQALTSVKGKSKYSGYTSTSVFSRSAEELIDNIRFPWYYSGRYEAIGEPESLHFTYDTKFDSPLFIAAPKEFVKKPAVGFYDTYRAASFSWKQDKDAAERDRANSILRKIKDYANARLATAPARLPHNYDPFVCSLCEYGVIIHTMWGAEAQDKTIKRYEDLREAIIGKGGDV